MRITGNAIVAGLAVLAACGGGGSKNNGPALNAYTGTITVSGALPAGVTTCQGTTQVVHFLAGGLGAGVHAVAVAGGGCVQFQNDDAVAHQPAPRASAPCAALNGAPQLAAGQSFTTGPLGSTAATQTCDWEDALNPPGTGGGGGY